MLSWIKDLLIFPDRFFSRIDKEDVNLVSPAIIVGLSGIISAVFLVGSTRIFDPFMLVMIRLFSRLDDPDAVHRVGNQYNYLLLSWQGVFRIRYH